MGGEEAANEKKKEGGWEEKEENEIKREGGWEEKEENEKKKEEVSGRGKAGVGK